MSRALGSRLVLFHPESREVSVLNATAAAVWELCDGETQMAEAVARLRERFRVGETRDLVSDLAAVLRTLSQRGLLSPSVPGAAEDRLP